MDKEKFKDTNSENKNYIKLNPLSPIDKINDPRINLYLNRIDDAIEEPDVYNLALTGVFGSGKSTILKSYKSKYPNKKTLSISLASFTEKNKYKDFKNEIHLTILQQILYSQSSEKLPQSRFNRISEINIWTKEYIIKVLILLIFIISSYFTLKFYTTQINPNNWSSNKIFSAGAFISVTLFIISLFYIIQFFFKTLINSKINKFNIKGDVEIVNKLENVDFLNKHIDEILYFFETIPTDIVIIEDIDRFDTIEIYKTFREINIIVNNYLKGIGKKKSTFLYAIKDNLFENEFDRTKFFDLIIPIIPYVDFSNSKNILTAKLKEINSDILDENQNKFINSVSRFILDNRILKNIINEFIVFREQQKIKGELLNEEKLLAIIIYKNLRPKDFSRLHNGNSNINIAFNYRSNLIKIINSDLNLKIKELQKEINEALTENLKSVRELNKLYIYEIKERMSSNPPLGLIINQKKISFQIAIERGENLISDVNIVELEYKNGASKIDSLLNEFGKTFIPSYKKRYRHINNKEGFISRNKKKIEGYKNIIKTTESQTLQQVFRNTYFSKKVFIQCFSYIYNETTIGEIYNNEKNKYDKRIYNDTLLFFLLENGYIKEDYQDYISKKGLII